MKLLPLALLASSVIAAQTPQFADPANLRGERVKPRDGRELPIDQPEPQGGRGLEQMLRRLNTRASLMLIVAHPDDEDGGMLTYCARGLGARVAMLTLSRGEGGQNAMTGDFEDALGLLRTQELLSADRYLGVDQMFGTEVDFGFSKTKEEAFRKWTHERVLYDAVRAVRLYRPLVIAAVFVGGVTDGHGQHQVSGEIAQEVFKAAGDPKIFPELTVEGILPWQPLKVYARVPLGAVTSQGLFDYATGQYAPARFTNYVTGEITTTVPSTDVVVHEGQSDPLLTSAGANPTDLANKRADPHAPLSYVQFARIGLGLQKSQVGPGVRNAPAGAFDVAYHRYGSRLNAAKQKAQESSFFDGIDTSLLSLQSLDSGNFSGDALAEASRAIQTANERFDSAHPVDVAPLLAVAAQKFDTLISHIEASTHDSPVQKKTALHELLVKRAQVNQALLLALGLNLTVEADSASFPIRQTVSATARLSQTSGEPVIFNRLLSVNSNGDSLTEDGRNRKDGEEPYLAQGHPVTAHCGLDPRRANQPTRPYFFRDSIEAPVYKLLDTSLRNAPMTPNALTCIAEVTYNGVRLQLAAVALHERQPVALLPPTSLTLSTHAQALPNAASSTRISTLLYPAASPQTRPKLVVPAGWKTTPAIDGTDAPGLTRFQIDPPATHRTAFTLTASTVLSNQESITEGYRSIGYGDLPRTNFFTPAAARLVPVDLKLPRRTRIAYLSGTGDSVPESLASIGLAPAILAVADLTPAKLASFDTVVLGVRTYNAHPELHGAPTEALLDFVRGGGNVVVQYQTAEFTGDDAPYPLSLGRDAEKVVDETAPVRLLDSGGSTLRTPNELTEADFNGWVAERGHGFLRTWDPRYTALTETHDPGSASEGVGPQAPQRGGLVSVRLGQGHWTYCAFALYRQLPEAVPGSFRLFSNLLALADQR